MTASDYEPGLQRLLYLLFGERKIEIKKIDGNTAHIGLKEESSGRK